MKVRTLKKHGNAWGDAYTKMPPKAYELPDDNAATLIDAGYVEEAKPAAKAAPEKPTA